MGAKPSAERATAQNVPLAPAYHAQNGGLLTAASACYSFKVHANFEVPHTMSQFNPVVPEPSRHFVSFHH
jgi:hypothetical protein